MADEETLRFYARNAQTYASRSRRPPQVVLDDFLTRLPPGGKVLELGAGGGQDAAYMLSRGFDVLPTDASPELGAEAEKRLGRPVVRMRFNELVMEAAFDGVWASAALLHAPAAELTGDLHRVHEALRANGWFFASFKAGEGEGRDSLGRFYNYPDRGSLTAHYRDAADWTALDIEEHDGRGYDGILTRWLWVRAQK